MRDSPCKDCLLLPCCRNRIEFGSVMQTASNENCQAAIEFFYNANQDEINEVRKLFGLRPYK